MGGDEYTLTVRNKKRTKIPFLDRVQQQRGSGQDLFTRDSEPVRDLAQCSIFGGGIILTIEPEQLADRVQVQRRLGIAKVAENLRHETIDVARCPFAQESVLQPFYSGVLTSRSRTLQTPPERAVRPSTASQPIRSERQIELPPHLDWNR